MNWTSFFIKRPVFSIALSLLIVLAGIFSYFELPLRLFPKIETPVISIAIEYPGADAAIMKDFVTGVIENALGGIQGINYITSSSYEGNARITVHMLMGTNSDSALTEVVQKVSAVRGSLPSDAYAPVVSKSDSDDNPTMLLAFTSNSMSRPQMADYLSRMIKPQLETIDGVSSAHVLGSQYAMRIWLDPDKMTAYNLSTQDVINAMHSQSVPGASGSLDKSDTSFNVTTNADLKTARQFNNIVIKNVNGSIVRLKDIGSASLGSETSKINALYNGQPAIMVFVKTQVGENPLVVVKSIKKILPLITSRLPGSMKLHEVVNVATYIHASIREVILSLLAGIIIVSLVIFMFVGSVGAVLIPVVTIPISLIGVCTILLVLGYSINLLVLLAMVVAIGLVVDDAIVVMENIFRHIESGLSVFKASVVGASEIASPVIAMSLTLAAIFSPIAFSAGLTGRLFSEFALSLAAMVIISGFVALTLSPMMCSRILEYNIASKKFVIKIENIFNYVRRHYVQLLQFAMNHKRIFLCVWIVAIIGCIYFYQSTPKELAPKEDEGVLQVIGTAPNATNTKFLISNTQQLNNVYKRFPEISSYIYINGIPQEHQVLSFIRLKAWNKRKLSSIELQQKLQAALNQISGLQSVAIVPSVLPGTQGFPVEFVIKSISNYKNLYVYAQKIMRAARLSGLFLFVDDDLKYDQPILHLSIDRDAAATLGVDINNITSTLASMLSGDKTQYFSLKGQAYEVIPQAMPAFRSSPLSLSYINVRTNSGHLVPLSALVDIHKKILPATFNKFQKFNSVTISGVMAPEYTLSQGLDFLANAAHKILPRDISYDYSGNSRQFVQEGHRMLWIFLASFLIIYLVLSMQFESFTDPLIILFGSVPMALMVAMIPLKLGFASMNIYTQIGLLTLVGLICKHGILMTKFANNLRANGCGKVDAISQSAAIRLRPILMTTLAIVFGVLPLVFAKGAGNVSRFDIGIVIAIGMLLGTIFTLFVLPVLYYYLSGKTKIGKVM